MTCRSLWTIQRMLLSGLGGLGAVVLGAELGDTIPTINPFGQTEFTLRSLQENQKRQMDSARTWNVVHDFRFEDRWQSSGIRFEHQAVDDAAKNYKAVHYDHGNGLAVADVDGDGRLDLYFVNQLGASQLWRNQGNGTFDNWTDRAGVGMNGRIAVGASFGDVDNDGRPDLFVTTVRSGNALFRNLGGGKFQDITAGSGLVVKRALHSSGAVFFDYNRDGLLDLFVVNVGNYTRNEKGPGGFYLARADAFQGWQFPARSEQSVLYKNLGGGKFEDVSKRTALEHWGWSGDATACDVNEDGFPDLYVLSMSGEDKYYENIGGQRFVDKTSAYFPKTPWGAMGVKFFDFNRDGRMDLYVTDMHSDMTTAQIQTGDKDFSPAFDKQKSDVWCSADWPAVAQIRATNCLKGNAFYKNLGGGRFEEISSGIGAETYWPWGITVADLNADGFEDAFVTAGMGYPLRYAVNSVLLNDGGQRFLDSEFVLGVEPRAGNRIEKEFFTLDCSGDDKRHNLCKGRTGKVRVVGTTSSRSSVALDLDGDGDLDLVTNEWHDHPQVLISNLAQTRTVRFLQVTLVGTTSNRSGLGTTVTVVSGGQTFTRYHDGKSGYLSQSLQPLYFGLGKSDRVDQIEVRWPSGRVQRLSDGFTVNSTVTITEPNR